MTCLLDTSALLSHFRGETGATRVQELFEDDNIQIAIASITITEFSRRMVELGAGRGEINQTLDSYGRMLAEIIPVDAPIATLAFELGLRSSTRLPLADALTAATAAHRNAMLIHRDPHFSALPQDAVQQEKL